jgi:flagellar L-ring protein precursor FlgH
VISRSMSMAIEPEHEACSVARLQIRFIVGSVTTLLVLGALTLSAQSKNTAVTAASATRSAKDPAAGSLDDYLRRVHAESAASRPEPGAIWTDNSRFARLTADVRAMQPHDLVSVVVSEALESSTDGTVKGSRASSASSAVSSLFQKLSAASAAQNLVNMNAQSALNAQGQSANNSSLSTVLGGEVVEVLPNGMLVIEAARQVEFSQQTQTVVLRGLVRPEDISQSNRVLSTAISDLTLQVRGHGIVTDYTHRPNVLVRLLQKALIF